MFKFYLTSVVIWMIITWCTVHIFKDKIKEKTDTINTEINKQRKVSLFDRLIFLFAISAIPIIRLIFVLVLVYIAICKQEDFDELIRKANGE